MLGYKTHADYVLEENMAKTPATVNEFLGRLWEPALKVAKKEREAMQAMIKGKAKPFPLASWDWWYYAER